MSPSSASDGNSTFSGSRKSFDIGNIPASSLSFRSKYASRCAQFFNLKKHQNVILAIHIAGMLYMFTKFHCHTYEAYIYLLVIWHVVIDKYRNDAYYGYDEEGYISSNRVTISVKRVKTKPSPSLKSMPIKYKYSILHKLIDIIRYSN